LVPAKAAASPGDPALKSPPAAIGQEQKVPQKYPGLPENPSWQFTSPSGFFRPDPFGLSGFSRAGCFSFGAVQSLYSSGAGIKKFDKMFFYSYNEAVYTLTGFNKWSRLTFGAIFFQLPLILFRVSPAISQSARIS
jgi:hypothetical protein